MSVFRLEAKLSKCSKELSSRLAALKNHLKIIFAFISDLFTFRLFYSKEPGFKKCAKKLEKAIEILKKS